MDKLYNAELKERYLNERFGDNEGSKATIRNLFTKSEMIEDILEKDLYNFTLEEIGKVIQNANPYSDNVAKSYVRAFSRYISWAIKLRDNNINPLKGVDVDWATQFVDHSKKVHFSYFELKKLVDGLNSTQDMALIWMLFEGVQGKRFSELRKLRYNTVNWNTNELTLQDEDFSERVITVSDVCMKYIENAYKAEKTIGEKEKEVSLVKSEFILKNAFSARGKSPDVSLTVIYSRIHRLKEKLNLDYLTANALRQSGAIWKAVQIYQRDGYYGKYKQQEEVGKQFDLPAVKSKYGNYFNSTLMSEYINPQKFKELYDIDIEFVESR